VYDANGNVTALIDPTTGTLTARYAYTPFGEAAEISGRAAHLNPFRFSTQYRDPETGHYHYGARQYDPESGRWLRRDPAGHRGGANEYAFLGNDPINQVDAGGLAPWRAADLFGAAELDLEEALDDAEDAARDLAFYDRELDAELHSAGLNCEWARELKGMIIDKAVTLGAATIRAANLANTYYADANPIGQRDAYAERLFALKGFFADASQLDYARLGGMRNSLEMLGTSLTAQLNTNGGTRAFAQVAATASFALLDAAGAPGLSKLTIGAFKAAGRKAATLLPETAQALSSAARPLASRLRTAASKSTNTLAKKAGTTADGYAKNVATIKQGLAGNPPSSRAGLVIEQAGTTAKTGTRAFYVKSARGTRAAAERAGDDVIKLSDRALDALNKGDTSLARTESTQWAQDAEGVVNVYVPELGGTGRSIYWTDELPILARNPKVIDIKYILVRTQ